ncbi:MAG: hypothetical protein HONDAALG_02662 [Gammaproteobacteria bacterium]|nr:hypothetical protein [Gammaproteobacteria bacterium]
MISVAAKIRFLWRSFSKTGLIIGIGTNLIGTDPNAIENVASGMSYRAWNAYWGMNFGNGLRQTAGYNGQRRQLTSIVVDRQNGSSTLLSKYYDYYTSGLNNGRIRRISDNSNFSSAANYGYDSFNRLTTLSGTLGGGFQYDEWGNMRSMYSSAISYATNGSGAPATNRISSAGGYSFSYDATRNMTAGNGQTFSKTTDPSSRSAQISRASMAPMISVAAKMRLLRRAARFSEQFEVNEKGLALAAAVRNAK